MPAFSKLQAVCLTFMTTSVDPVDLNTYVNLLSEDVFDDAHQIVTKGETLVSAIASVCAGGEDSVAKLKGYFNFVMKQSEQSYESLLGLSKPIHPQQKTYLKTIYDLLNDYEEQHQHLQLRPLSDLEKALCSVLTYTASKNFKGLPQENLDCMKKAVLGDEVEQSKILKGSVIPAEVENGLSVYTRQLLTVIEGYKSIFNEAVRNLYLANQEEKKRDANIKEMMKYYQAAYSAAIEASEFNHPESEMLLGVTRSAPYNAAIAKKAALRDEDSNENETLLIQAEILALQAKHFGFESADQLDQFLFDIRQLMTAHQQEQAEKAYKNAVNVFEDAKRRSVYMDAVESAKIAKDLGSEKEQAHYDKAKNEYLEKRFRVINANIGEWLENYQETINDKIISDLQKLKEQVNSKSFKVDPVMSDLVRSCYKMIDAGKLLAERDFTEAEKIANEFYSLNTNASVIQALIKKLSQEETLPPQKPKKMKPKLPVEEEVEEAGLQKKVKKQPRNRKLDLEENLLKEKNLIPPRRKVLPRQQEENFDEIAGQQGDIHSSLDSNRAKLTKPPKIHPQLQEMNPGSESEKIETVVTSSFSPASTSPITDIATEQKEVEKISPTNKVEEETFSQEDFDSEKDSDSQRDSETTKHPLENPDQIPQDRAALKTHLTYSQSVKPSEPTKQSSSKWGLYLGIGLLIFGGTLIAAGVIALTFFTGGLALIIGISALAAGTLASTAGGTLVIRDRVKNSCTGGKDESEPKNNPKLNQEQLSPASDSHHYPSPVGLNRRNSRKEMKPPTQVHSSDQEEEISHSLR